MEGGLGDVEVKVGGVGARLARGDCLRADCAAGGAFVRGMVALEVVEGVEPSVEAGRVDEGGVFLPRSTEGAHRERGFPRTLFDERQHLGHHP